MIKEGKFNHIGLSEVSAATIRRAHKVHPISTVEIEYSLWSIEAKHNGVLSTCKELGITVIAYSPLGRGILAGKWTKPEDVPPMLRQMSPRYSDENFEANAHFVTFLNEMAKRKGVMAAQIAIKWVLTEGDYIIPIPGATALSRVNENMSAAGVELTKEELEEINQYVEKAEVKGDRYGGAQVKLLWG
jgi:pyridoxine 4-dehydrogenase